MTSALIPPERLPPQRVDGQGFVDLFDDLVVGNSTSLLIKQKYLSKFRLFATSQSISTVGVEKTKGDFRASALALAVTSQIGAPEIYQNYLLYARNLRTVIFAVSLEHSRALAEFFSQQGIKAEHLDGSTPPEERADILRRFRNGKTSVLTNYEILTEGYDCPDIECVYCVRPTQSSTLWLQMTGRVLRTGALKPTAVIIDVTDNWLKHGLPDEPRQWSLQPKTVLSLSDGWGKKCPSCTHVFKPLSSELEILSAEIGADGLLIRHHQATCPSCGGQVEFTTKESTQSDAPAIYRIKIRNAITLDITEVDLTSNTQKLELIRKMLYQQGLKNQPPTKIYKAIFMGFIENINEFTLGDWREIVKMIEPSEPIITKKAWELYQESLVRYKNRQMALSFIEKRNNQNQNSSSLIQKVPSTENQEKRSPSKPSSLLKAVGNPYFQNKYAAQWQESLANVKTITAEFLTNNAGLFHVEIQRKNVNISLEIKASPNLKSQMKEVFDAPEIQAAFSLGFGKAAIVMVRLAS